LKIVSTRPVTSAEFGIYSHKLGDYWQAGGASNSGGAVLAHYFTSQQLAALTPLVKPDQPTRLNYYPLLQNGERFPLNDPNFAPRLLPEAGSDAEFFQGILEGISQIELDGYNKLQQLGAPYPTQVFSAGGGSENAPWTQIRQQRLGVKLRQTEYSEACYGSALLAMRGVVSDSKTR
jgi:sugar (pentulose or hexulose) kinase